MRCPHCGIGIYQNVSTHTVVKSNSGLEWQVLYQQCPECSESIIYLGRNMEGTAPVIFRAYPAGVVRPAPVEVTDPYRQDFKEAVTVLPHSPRASAALSRRCLQAILTDRAGTRSRDLDAQIEEVVASGKVPSYITDDLKRIRTAGNFTAYPAKSVSPSVIADAEPGEAEWNLDVLEALFDFYFVQPAIASRRKQDLNRKLQDAGRPAL